MIFILALDTLLIDSLWETAKLWRAGTNVPKVDSARNRIISMGEEAVHYVILKYLPEDDRFQMRAIRDICRKVPKICSPAIGQVLEMDDTIAQKNALYVAAEVSMPSLEDRLLKLLREKKDKRWKSRILRALYRSGSKRSCSEVVKLSSHPYEYVRMRVFLFLGQHGCKRYKEVLWKGLNDSPFMVRDAARESLAKLGFSIYDVKKHLQDVKRIEIFKLLAQKCTSKDFIFLLKPQNVFERYWYARISCGR
ncbi:MAG: hypothetical protein GXO39_07045 [Thermotogae bacterium]|nr:hypothetical protein [Thermotogota bacterium]